MKSWKTTLAGIGMGVGYAFLSALSTGIKPKDAAISVGLALLGGLSKDYDKTNSQKPGETQNSSGDAPKG